MLFNNLIALRKHLCCLKFKMYSLEPENANIVLLRGIKKKHVFPIEDAVWNHEDFYGPILISLRDGDSFDTIEKIALEKERELNARDFVNPECSIEERLDEFIADRLCISEPSFTLGDLNHIIAQYASLCASRKTYPGGILNRYRDLLRGMFMLGSKTLKEFEQAVKDLKYKLSLSENK